MFTCSKFHEYIYGQQFVVESDHKSLKNVFWSPIHKTPPWIQRFIMFLQKYSFIVEYVPGKQMIRSDTMSRAALTDNRTELTESDIKSAAPNYNPSKTKPRSSNISMKDGRKQNQIP